MQLSTTTTKRVSEVVNECHVEVNGTLAKVNLNIFPLDLYEMLTRMDWLELLRAKVDCYNKFIEGINDEGQFQVIKEILKPISIKKLTALQLRKYFMKRCQVYAVFISK